MEITINGEPRDVRDWVTVAELLVDLGKNPRFLAIERNQLLVPRTTHANCMLKPGDRIEIVTLVGGG